MHSFAQTNGQYQQIGPLQQASQAAPHPPYETTRALSANNSYQYMTINSGVQSSQSANFALQSGSSVEMQMAPNKVKNDVVIGNPLLKMLLLEPEMFLNSQSQNSSPPISHGSQAPTQQNCLYSTNQSLSNATKSNTTYPRQDMTVPWTQSVAVNERQTVKALNVSHLQQYTTSQSLHQNSNVVTTRPLPSYTAAAPSPPQQQIVNTNTLMYAGSQNVQISQVAPNQFGQNSAEGRFASAYQSSWNVVTSQPIGNGNVLSQTFSNRQVPYVMNQSQKSQQQTTYPCSSYNDCGNPNNSWNTNMINHSNSNFSLVKANEVPLNPPGGSQQMLRHHVSADSLGQFCTVSSERYPPPYDHQHFISSSKMSKQNIQPVISAHSESYNINATQPMSLISGQSLPQSVMSRGQLTVNSPPQQIQKPLPKDYHINSKQDKRKQKMATDSLSSNRIISKECPVTLRSLCSPVKQKDNASHSMLGHTSTRAVAVVPPLSQETGNTFSNTAAFESVDPAEKTRITPDLAKGAEVTSLRGDADLNEKTSSPTEASKVASNLGAVLTTSESESQRSPECPSYKLSKESSQTCSKEQSETVQPASPPVLELSSLPTNTWTTEALSKLITETEQDQSKPEENSGTNLTVKLLIMFWDKNIKKLLQYIKARQSFDFDNISKDISDKSVILSEVKPDFKDHLKHYRVLEDGEVFLEQPYKSLWLNVNYQLDDIDKEFGFPWSLKQHLCVNETDSQIDPPNTEHSIPEPMVNEVHNKVLSQTESEMVEEKSSTVECSPPPPASQNESEDSSSESDLAFRIEVLPPETAKSIFEQVQKLTPQRTDCVNGTMSSSSLQTGTNKDSDSTLNTSTVENKSDDKIKEICCLAKFIEMFSISDVPSSKCVCNVEQSCNRQTVKTPNPDPDSSAKSNEVTDCQTITLSSSELCSKLEQIIDLTDEDDEVDQSSEEVEVDEDQETGIISQISTGNLLNIVIKSESEDNEVATPDFAIAGSPFTLQISETESEDNCPPEELNTAGSIPTNMSVSSAKKTESDQLCTTEAENVLQLSDQDEYYEPAHLKLTVDEESPLESKQNTQTTFYRQSVNNKPTEKKHRQSSLDQFFPGLKTSKCKGHTDLELLDIPVAQPQSSEVKTVELVLFGSGQREGLVPENAKNKPPEVLSVNLDPSRRKFLEANCPKKYSAKHLIYERWRKTFPANLIGSNIKGFRNKWKRQKRLSASLPSTSSTHQQLASSEFQVPDGLSKNRLSLKRRRSLSLIRRHEKIKRRRYSVTLEQPATEEENRTLNGNHDNMPPRENIVLKFSVLPNTFHFPDDSSGMKKTSGSDMPEIEDENQSLKKTVGKSKVGSWCPTAEKQYKPLCAPQTVSLFQEYQKKYKEKAQVSTDELSDK